MMKHHTIYAKTKPEAPAVIMAENEEIVSWKEFDRRINRLARYFRDIGLKEKDRMAVLMENNARYLEIITAALDAGLIFTPISTHLKQSETEYIINNSGAKLLITSQRYADLAGRISAGTPDLTHRLMLGKAIPGYDDYEGVVSKYEDIPIDYAFAGMPMFYSSGTTGTPKGVVWNVDDFPVGDLDPSLEGAFAFFGIDENVTYLSTQPLYHSAPCAYASSISQVGGTIILMEKFEAEKALSLIDTFRVTHSQWVPTMFIRLLKLPENVRDVYDVSSLKMAIHAAAPCPIEVKEKMIDWWGPILLEYWGGTETSMVTIITSQEWLEHKGSVGKGLLAKLHILDDEGKELPPGKPGVIYMESGRPFSYHKEPEKTSSSRNEQGWTSIGDIGYLDEEGYLYLTDRKSFMIISGGVNIYPQETEDVLIMHEKVADVAVIGMPDEDFGETVKAVVQPVNASDAGPELEKELIEFCRSRISHIKCPKSVDFMEDFPRTPTGKVLKRVIKEKYK
ncbi:MAG: AMP-binding protein [Desulfobacterales bacterium]